MTIVLQVVAFVYVLVLPGALLMGRLEPTWSRAMRLLVGFAISALALPMACFVVAWVLGTNLKPPLVLGTATAVNLALGAAWLGRRRPHR